MGISLPNLKKKVNEFVGGFVDQGKAGARSVQDIIRGAAASSTNNPIALANANRDKARDNPAFLAPIARPFIQAAETIVHPLSAHTVTPKTAEEQRILGTVPIQNINAGVKTNYEAHANLNPAARIALAGGYGLGQAAQDVFALQAKGKAISGITKAALPGTKSAVKLVDKVVEPAAPKLSPVKIKVNDASIGPQSVKVNTPVKITVKDKSTGATSVKVVNPVQRVDEIRAQLATMPSAANFEVAKFNQRSNLAKVVNQIRSSGRTAPDKQALIKRVTDRYKQNLVSMESVSKQRAVLDEEASQLKQNPSYQAARPVGNQPVVVNRAIDSSVTPNMTQMQNDIANIKTMPGDDETGANSIKIGGPTSKEVRIKVKTPPKYGVDNLQKLNIKISRVKDPIRKAQLVQEREERFPNRAKVNLKVSPSSQAKDAPNAFQRAWQSSRGVISQHGAGGKEIANRLQLQRDASEIGQEAFVKKIPSVLALKKNEFKGFVDELEARSANKATNKVTPGVSKAVEEWNAAIPDIRDQAIKTGLDVGDLGPNYFPRFYSGLKSASGRSSMAAKMVKSGQAKTLGEAMDKLRFMQREYTRPFGNLEKTRVTDLPDYDKNHKALLDYISRSFDRITKAEQFGSKNEKLNELIGATEAEGYDVGKNSVFDKTLKTAIGDTDYSTAAHRASAAIRQMNAVRSLSTASITNAGQLVNTATVAGTRTTLRSIVKALTSKNAREGARDAGVLLDHTINDLASQGLGSSSSIAQNIASPFFRTVEKFNRTASAIAGRELGQKLAAKADTSHAQRILRDTLGVKGEIVGGKLSPTQETQAARGLVEATQFKVDPQDLPAWVDSPTGKLVAQFRTFGYKQTGFIYNQVLREAVVHGNYAPLARMILVGAPAGAASMAVKGAIKGKIPFQASDAKDPKKLGKDALQGLQAIGAGGLPVSEANNLITSSNYGDTLQGIAGTVGGPTGSIIGETATNIDKARAGNSTPIKKEAIRNIPLVGSTAASRIYPSKVTDETTAYYKRLNQAKSQLKGDTKSTAEFNSYIAKSKNPDNGKSIQLSPRQSIDNSGSLYGNDKLRKTVTGFEKDQKSHDPMWDLPDDKLKTFLSYKAQFTGSDEKTFIKSQAANSDGTNWIQQLQDKQSKFYDKLPKGTGKGSERNPASPEYPKFDKQTSTLLDAYNKGDSNAKAQLNQQYAGELSDAFGKIADYTNKMRKAEGAPALKSYPKADEQTQQIISYYNGLPKGENGGKSTTRSNWIKSHPDDYARMQSYLSQASMYSLVKNAAQDQFAGSTPSQTLLKDIKNVGQYDISTGTDAAGNKIFSLDPQAASAQSSGGSSYNPDKYLRNPDKFRVSARKRTRSKVSFAKSTSAPKKFKVATIKPVKNKKVALKKSKV